MRHGFTDVVTAVDHTVTIDRLDDVAGLKPHPAVHPADKQIGDLPALGAKEQRLRAARCAAGGVEYDRRPVWAANPAKIAIGRVGGNRGHQVRFVIDRQFGDVGQAADVTGLKALRAPQALVKGNLPAARHQLQEADILQRKKFIAAHADVAGGEIGSDRIIGQHLLCIEALKIGRETHCGSVK